MSETREKQALSPGETFVNRELSWLSFASRVLALAADPDLPLLERFKFAGILGMLHDEFFMKRISGLKRHIAKSSRKLSLDGRTPGEEFEACSEELHRQDRRLSELLSEELLPALEREGSPVLDYAELDEAQRDQLRRYFRKSVQPILTPLAVDNEHPFPFISGGSLNLAVLLPSGKDEPDRFVRIKVPGNRPRWVPLDGDAGFVPLEQVIAQNLDLMFPDSPPKSVHAFRVIRGASGDDDDTLRLGDGLLREPGRIVELVSRELKARKFAGVVRLQVAAGMPKKMLKPLVAGLGISKTDVYPSAVFLGLDDLLQLDLPGRDDLCFPPHKPVTHPRLRGLDDRPGAVFDEITKGDILLQHPYHSFDTSVLRFLESAALDPQVLAIKLTIYRTGSDSPILRALAEASRRGKQVAVLVEITARFDEAPNIAWGKFLEKEGVHVSYGVERLKTHVKLALVVREEAGEIHRYAHFGTGNYNVRTARIYEDVGILTADPAICEDVAAAFNSLTGATPTKYAKMLVAPHKMRAQFVKMIRREAKNAAAGRPSGIFAKMNQLQDAQIIRELYAAAGAGVPVRLCVRGLCCVRPGVEGLSESVRVFSVVGRFLEHSRVYRFENGGQPRHFIGSADWMKRNLDSRVETVVPVLDPELQRQLDEILAGYERDNSSAWDCGPDGVYVLRQPADGEPRQAVQDELAAMASGKAPAASKSGDLRPPVSAR